MCVRVGSWEGVCCLVGVCVCDGWNVCVCVLPGTGVCVCCLVQVCVVPGFHLLNELWT